MEKEATLIQALLEEAKHVLIIQADNPDGDSLGSSIALEQILASLGKETTMVCGVNLPSYLSYLPGWNRVECELPPKFDLSIIVDTSSASLLESLTKGKGLAALSSKPCIILDHHLTEPTIGFAKIALIIKAAATAEVIYELAQKLKWDLPLSAMNPLAAAILSDTMGLTADYTTSRTVHIIGDMVAAGVSLSSLENARRDTNRKSVELVHYKGRLLQRIEYYAGNRVALLCIPWPEIEQYSPLYNPSMLALDDMRLTTGTAIAVVLKLYPDGKITAKIRSNYGAPIARKLAEHFGGGGHDYASGFKLVDNKELGELKNLIITKAEELLDEAI